MTIGILLKRLQSALSHENEVTWFDAISHIVLDEVHERDLDTDLLLVILKRMLKTRREAGLHTPKILLMSATFNADLFRNYFRDTKGQQAPLVDVPGKTYPVARHYLNDFITDLQSRSNAVAGWVFQVRVSRRFLLDNLLTRQMDTIG
jgi:HrpA-like RNA helicase